MAPRGSFADHAVSLPNSSLIGEDSGLSDLGGMPTCPVVQLAAFSRCTHQSSDKRLGPSPQVPTLRHARRPVALSSMRVSTRRSFSDRGTHSLSGTSVSAAAALRSGHGLVATARACGRVIKPSPAPSASCRSALLRPRTFHAIQPELIPAERAAVPAPHAVASLRRAVSTRARRMAELSLSRLNRQSAIVNEGSSCGARSRSSSNARRSDSFPLVGRASLRSPRSWRASCFRTPP